MWVQNLKILKTECINSLARLPNRNFAAFVTQCLLEVLTQTAKHVINCQVSQALSMFVVNTRVTPVMPSLQCKQIFSYILKSEYTIK